MTAALRHPRIQSPATGVHHLPGRRAVPGGLSAVPDADTKLDQLLGILTDVQVKVGETAVRIEALTTAHEHTAGDLVTQREALADLRDRVTSLEHTPDPSARLVALEARPVGVTPRQLWAALASAEAAAAGTVAVLAFLLDHVRLT